VDGKETYAVATIGISGRERYIVESILKLSSYRAPTYILSNMTLNSPAEILIINADDKEAMNKWQRLCSPSSKSFEVPSIMVTSDRENRFVYQLNRPLVAKRILDSLDRVVREKPHHHNHRIIGGKTDESGVAVKLNASTPTSPSLSIAHPEKAPYNALVVDDSLVVRKQIELELGLSGIACELVETGEEALDLLGKRSYDLIFLDVVLPGIDGYQICKKIKRSKETRHIPVVMLTSKSSPFDRVRGTLSGCASYLTKPIDQSDFHKTIRRYLQ
jgi:two-component system cell cycle response regulator